MVLFVDGYLLVLLRGDLVHLLNVSILTEPGQHFLYHGKFSWKFQTQDVINFKLQVTL